MIEQEEIMLAVYILPSMPRRTSGILVVAVGPARKNDRGEEVAMYVKVNDKVLINKYA